MKIRAPFWTAQLVLAASLVAATAACAQNRETRSLTGFDAVEVGGGVDLYLRQGQPLLVEVQSSEPEDIVTEVRGRTLSIHRRRSFGWFNWGGDGGAVHVTLPVLLALTASGGSDARAEGTFSGERLELVASGGSDLTIDVDVDDLEAVTSGGSDLRLRGSARSARLQSSGGSDLDAAGFTADEADVQSSGGSDVAIDVRERIAGHASGGSDIVYTGRPRTVEIRASGGSDVHGR